MQGYPARAEMLTLPDVLAIDVIWQEICNKMTSRDINRLGLTCEECNKAVFPILFFN